MEGTYPLNNASLTLVRSEGYPILIHLQHTGTRTRTHTYTSPTKLNAICTALNHIPNLESNVESVCMQCCMLYIVEFCIFFLC